MRLYTHGMKVQLSRCESVEREHAGKWKAGWQQLPGLLGFIQSTSRPHCSSRWRRGLKDPRRSIRYVGTVSTVRRRLLLSTGGGSGSDEQDPGPEPEQHKKNPLRQVLGYADTRVFKDPSGKKIVHGVRVPETGEFLRVRYPAHVEIPAVGERMLLLGRFSSDENGTEIFEVLDVRFVSDMEGPSRPVSNNRHVWDFRQNGHGLLSPYALVGMERNTSGPASNANQQKTSKTPNPETASNPEGPASNPPERPRDESERKSSEPSASQPSDIAERVSAQAVEAERPSQSSLVLHGDTAGSSSDTKASNVASSELPPAQESREVERSTIEGTIKSILYRNAQNEFVVCVLSTGEKIIGSCAEDVDFLLKPGARVRLRGAWVTHPVYGKQFQAGKIRESAFIAESEQDQGRVSLVALKSYLASGVVKGVGVKMAERIINRFGESTLHVLDTDPANMLTQVEGIGRVRAEQIATAWRAQAPLRALMLFLRPYGIGPAICNRIARAYEGDPDPIGRIRLNPYRLVEDVRGVGFRTADQIAAGLGIDPESPERYAAGLLNVLQTAENLEGHSFLPKSDAFDRVLRLLFGTNAAASDDANLAERQARFSQAVEDLKRRQALVVNNIGGDEEPHLLTPRMDRAERGIIEHLRRLFFHSRKPIDSSESARRAVEGHVNREHILRWINVNYPTLSAAQREAVCVAAEQPIMILSGGPGVGKTHTATAIVHMWRTLLGIENVQLTAPTGRAANRLGTAANVWGNARCATIHRCLECDRQGRFLRNEHNQLNTKAVIVDECSMMDALLAHALLQAIPNGARLVLIGDADQLPSVGPGRVFADLCESNAFPTIYLQEIFRQALKSMIVRVAHEARNGRYLSMPRAKTPAEALELGRKTDLVFLEAADPVIGLQFLLELCCGRDNEPEGERKPVLPFDPLKEIQVLSPGHRGVIGVRNLNLELQKRLNPTRLPLSKQARTSEVFLRIGDRVVQNMNNYDKGVFNGEVGTVMHVPDLDAIDSDNDQSSQLLVEFQNHDDWVAYDYPMEAADQLQLAWAMSVHKAQGGGYPCVVIPIFMTHSALLTRNLFYTAITRAQELCVVIGNLTAIRMAIRNEITTKRNTSLLQRLDELELDAK